MTLTKQRKVADTAPEHAIQNAILSVLPYYGVYAWRNNVGMASGMYKGKAWFIKMGKAGLPDIIGVQKRTGRMVAIEVKRPGKTPTDIQERVMGELHEYGALVFVATSVDEVIAKLQEKRNV